MNFLTEELLYQKSSQELTAFLYEAGIARLTEALDCIEEKKFDQANEKLQKVNDILQRLGAGINYEAGAIANQLDTLYNYMANQVIQGNLKKDVTILQEVKTILEQLASAWSEAMKKDVNDGERERIRKMSAYEKHVAVYTEE